MNYDIVIIGGGLAGLTAALHFSQHHLKVLVVEKHPYPNHKVCGEYVSNEVRPYLTRIGVPLGEIPVADIGKLQISTLAGKSVTTKLPLGGFGISRYCLDQTLYKTALNKGVAFLFDTVTQVEFLKSTFRITLSDQSELAAKWVIGAHGKRSVLDKSMGRGFIKKKSEWLGVKCHYQIDGFPNDLVALHTFNGGYGGLSKTEQGYVNFCYLATYQSFKKHKNVENFNRVVIAENPFLKDFLNQATPVFEQPMSIAQVSFDQKGPVENHMLMCGDSAGLIHPLCGNGMAMAIHSAKMASEAILRCFSSKTTSRQEIEKEYRKRWRNEFWRRLWMGRQLQRLFLSQTFSDLAMNTIANSEIMLQKMIRQTHGKQLL